LGKNASVGFRWLQRYIGWTNSKSLDLKNECWCCEKNATLPRYFCCKTQK
jgi:hypothetical protein